MIVESVCGENLNNFNKSLNQIFIVLCKDRRLPVKNLLNQNPMCVYVHF